MDIKIIPEVFERVDKIKLTVYKTESISEKLLLLEGLRLLSKLNFNVNTQLSITHRGSLTTFLSMIDSKTLEKLHEIRSEMCKRKGEVFGEPFIQLFLNWEMLKKNESMKMLSDANPFEYFIRILERGVAIYKTGNFIELSSAQPYDYQTLLLRENYQETPYLVSTTDEYLGKIDVFFSEHNELPIWLEEDNKRGYLL